MPALSTVVGLYAEIWLGIPASHQLHEAREKQHEQLENTRTWAERFPLRDLWKLGIIDRTRDPAVWIGQLLGFFNVSSPEAWKDVYEQKAIAFRKSPSLRASAYGIAAWLEIAEIETEKFQTQPYVNAKLRESPPEIRSLTLVDPEVFEPEIRRLCAASGVALVLVPELGGACISGATEWLNPETAMIGLGLRRKSGDCFWFAFFHELGHVILHGKR